MNAALQAREHGAKVTLLEAAQVGGTSLNRGPAPVRTLASAARLQTVAACMAADMTIELVAELQLAFPTFTEAICMAAQKVCRTLGLGRFPRLWSYLVPES